MAVPGVSWGIAGRARAEGAGRTGQTGCKLQAAAAAQGCDIARSLFRQPNLLRAATLWPWGWDGGSHESSWTGACPQQRCAVGARGSRSTDHTHVSTAAREASSGLTACTQLLQEGPLSCWCSATRPNPLLISPSSCGK